MTIAFANYYNCALNYVNSKQTTGSAPIWVQLGHLKYYCHLILKSCKSRMWFCAMIIAAVLPDLFFLVHAPYNIVKKKGINKAFYYMIK